MLCGRGTAPLGYELPRRCCCKCCSSQTVLLLHSLPTAMCLHAPSPCSGCIGEGAYARVYQGVDGDCSDVALKREAPPCPWEW